MSLIQSARMSGHDPYAYLKDLLTRLPTHKDSRIEERLLFRWQPTASDLIFSHGRHRRSTWVRSALNECPRTTTTERTNDSEIE